MRKFEPTRTELNDALSAWIIRKYAVDEARWRYIRARKFYGYTLNKALRQISSTLLSSVRPRQSHRTVEYVESHYSQTWTRYTWPDPNEPQSHANTVYLQWEDKGYEVLRSGLVRLHLLGIAKFIEAARPTTVLEIGAGPGINLLTLSACFPATFFTGAELTSAGVAAAEAAQADQLPDTFNSFAPLQIKDRSAHRKVDFNQCNATSLPFADNAFDLVFSRLAVEQMEQVRDQALSEIKRVAKSHIVFVEPFADFNTDPLMKLATTTKNYISLSCSDLPKFGLKPQLQFSDWPHKITNGAGLVVCSPR